MELLNRLRRWHQTWAQPLATYDDEHASGHHCLNCGKDYEGDFCPRCGQPASVGRFTWKSLLTSLLELWDFNTRSIPSTLLQLFYRPGYLLKDYLQGRRQSYYPPIKLLVSIALVAALWAYWFLPDKEEKAQTEVVATANRAEKAPDGEQVATAGAEEPDGMAEAAAGAGEAAAGTPTDAAEEADENIIVVNGKKLDKEAMENDIFDQSADWTKNNRGWAVLFICSFLILPTCLIFRRAPGYSGITIPECFFVQAYLSVIVLLFAILSSLGLLYGEFSLLFIYIAYYQLFGYGWWGTFWRTTLVLVLGFLTFILIAVLVYLIYYYAEIEVG